MGWFTGVKNKLFLLASKVIHAYGLKFFFFTDFHVSENHIAIIPVPLAAHTKARNSVQLSSTENRPVC